MRAKMVMRRDLMILRATKAQEEAEASAKPAEATKDVGAAQPVANGVAQDTEDLTMSDGPIMPDAVPKVEDEEKAAQDPTVAPPKSPEAPMKDEPVPAAKEEPTTTAEDSTKEEPTTADDGTMDEFDDIFGEFAQTSPNNDEPVNSIDMSDFPDTNADVSSLLPGLENYASMPDTTMADTSVPEPTTTNAATLDSGGLDFGMLGIPGQDESQDKKPQDVLGDGQLDDVGQDGGYDNTFEDLFDLDYELGLTGDGDGDANNNDLDEWMKSLE
jgi:hypothetical protein